MKRIFSPGGGVNKTGGRVHEHSASRGESPNDRSRSSSFTRFFGQSRETSSLKMKGSVPSGPSEGTPDVDSMRDISPELVPIITLLSAQMHRRYHEGTFLVLSDLKSDGTAGDRVWREVYGVLIGTQLALWDSSLVAGGVRDAAVLRTKAKPQYINFADSVFRPLGPQDTVTTESSRKLTNTLAVSTTLKNRYFLQFTDVQTMNHWHAAFRLAAFEFTALQEAYTGALLSTRGALLSDIRVILADTKFDYEEWVNVRFGAGMRWKRCYAVITQPSKKKNASKHGEIAFYETDKKIKKKAIAMATVTAATAVYALYPSSPMLVDSSALIKLEGTISLSSKGATNDTDVFILPEKHSAVPGYDTIIRFLVPAMNAFRLYGRPKTLSASKDDTNSLLFSLPALPHVHYLLVEDLLPLVNSASGSWTTQEWRRQIKALLQRRVAAGYQGCGSSSGLSGALSSPALGPLSPTSLSSPHFAPSIAFSPTESNYTFMSSHSRITSLHDNIQRPILNTVASTSDNTLHPNNMLSPAGLAPDALARPSLSKDNSSARDTPGNRLEDPSSSSASHTTQRYSPSSQGTVNRPATQQGTVSSGSPPKSVPYPEEQEPPLGAIPHRTPTPTKESMPEPPSTATNSYDSFARYVDASSGSIKEVGDPKAEYNPRDLYKSRADLVQIYDNYAASPFGRLHNSPGRDSSFMAPPPHAARGSPQSRDSFGAYDEYKGSTQSKQFDISNLRNSSSTHNSNNADGEATARSSSGSLFRGSSVAPLGEDDILDDFYNLSKAISKVGDSEANRKADPTTSGSRPPYDDTPVNVFDPDYVEQQNFILQDHEYVREGTKISEQRPPLGKHAVSYTGPTASQESLYKNDSLSNTVATKWELIPNPGTFQPINEKPPLPKAPGIQNLHDRLQKPEGADAPRRTSLHGNHLISPANRHQSRGPNTSRPHPPAAVQTQKEMPPKLPNLPPHGEYSQLPHNKLMPQTSMSNMPPQAMPIHRPPQQHGISNPYSKQGMPNPYSQTSQRLPAEQQGYMAPNNAPVSGQTGRHMPHSQQRPSQIPTLAPLPKPHPQLHNPVPAGNSYLSHMGAAGLAQQQPAYGRP
ncbi:AFR684Cp [Eremothecium gossypii ATCC 10895]|uniref:AFR684Cp n=1 Tax=Eremothecium gossypii (strain ATCC 10895 / CBS 109.51 / FGSC 9923 / NRRL Y-1056) TaxID=284811 RepID=Q751Z1_EREGS|nr:AFR684Cp [Eremothecium gossypii ATCC 10895]AAS54056.2 AFR684Cp [Eremothecium gossypii ATCC 10895]AEY98371.1 FAFR684Cp [Eremothecium gossypii FDAG1]